MLNYNDVGAGFQAIFSTARQPSANPHALIEATATMLVFVEPDSNTLKLNAVQMRIARQGFLEDERLLQPTLNQLGARTEEIALAGLAKKLGIKVVNLAASELPEDVLDAFPIKIIHRRNVFPLGVQPDGALYVATCNPFDLSAVLETLENSGRNLESFNGFLRHPEELRHSYEKFRFTGDVSKPPFEDVYRTVKTYIKDVLPKERNRDYER